MKKFLREELQALWWISRNIMIAMAVAATIGLFGYGVLDANEGAVGIGMLTGALVSLFACFYIFRRTDPVRRM